MREAKFIPCGDSMEKMEDIKKTEINEEELESVSGGIGLLVHAYPELMDRPE